MKQHHESGLVEDTILHGKIGWILPNGKFFSCHYGEHRLLAEEILFHIFNDDEYGGFEIRLENKGCIKVGLNLSFEQEDLKPGIILRDETVITPAQEKTIVNWCIKHNCPIPSQMMKEE